MQKNCLGTKTNGEKSGLKVHCSPYKPLEATVIAGDNKAWCFSVFLCITQLTETKQRDDARSLSFHQDCLSSVQKEIL